MPGLHIQFKGKCEIEVFCTLISTAPIISTPSRLRWTWPNSLLNSSTDKHYPILNKKNDRKFLPDTSRHSPHQERFIGLRISFISAQGLSPQSRLVNGSIGSTPGVRQVYVPLPKSEDTRSAAVSSLHALLIVYCISENPALYTASPNFSC